MIRAAAVPAQIGDLRPELLTAGHAIIHDKIIVIDPMDPVKCAVVTGSHNLGFKACYQNDENLLILRGNRSLAISYAVHVLDVYDHYVMRAKLADELRKSLIDTGLPPPEKTGGGFLDPKPSSAWQKRWVTAGPAPTSRDYFLSKLP
jgi:phosphatidylserine/phosphatidylglycerophosphate/cardiolipin synthase-like enzyme